MEKLNYFDWAIYTIANCECLPEGIKVSPLKLDSAEHPTAIVRNHHDKSYILSLQCEAPKISKLVYNSNNYGLWYL